jgi:hypothetical protein
MKDLFNVEYARDAKLNSNSWGDPNYAIFRIIDFLDQAKVEDLVYAMDKGTELIKVGFHYSL